MGGRKSICALVMAVLLTLLIDSTWAQSNSEKNVEKSSAATGEEAAAEHETATGREVPPEILDLERPSYDGSRYLGLPQTKKVPRFSFRATMGLAFFPIDTNSGDGTTYGDLIMGGVAEFGRFFVGGATLIGMGGSPDLTYENDEGTIAEPGTYSYDSIYPSAELMLSAGLRQPLIQFGEYHTLNGMLGPAYIFGDSTQNYGPDIGITGGLQFGSRLGLPVFGYSIDFVVTRFLMDEWGGYVEKSRVADFGTIFEFRISFGYIFNSGFGPNSFSQMDSGALLRWGRPVRRKEDQ